MAEIFYAFGLVVIPFLFFFYLAQFLPFFEVRKIFVTPLFCQRKNGTFMIYICLARRVGLFILWHVRKSIKTLIMNRKL